MVETMYGTEKFRILVYHPTVLIMDSYIDFDQPIKAPADMADGISEFYLLLDSKFME
jgi:hypothetical protein